VAARLSADFGPSALTAISPWRCDRGETDPVMLDLLSQARRQLPVGVLSNTTDAFRDDLRHHGIADAFDHILPSAEIGVDKPSPLAFEIAAERMRVAPRNLYYVDDEPTFVKGARHAGLIAELFTSADAFAGSLRRFGIDVVPSQLRAC
jgi:FMN phosphatase YigB (HAD superfamily)